MRGPQSAGGSPRSVRLLALASFGFLASVLVLLAIIRAFPEVDASPRRVNPATRVPRPASPEQQALDDQIAATAAEGERSTAETLADRRNGNIKGLGCLSLRDGSSAPLVTATKAGLRDPSSFEHVETRIAPAKAGQHTVTMSYRARNALGGLVLRRAVGLIDAKTCDLVRIVDNREF